MNVIKHKSKYKKSQTEDFEKRVFFILSDFGTTMTIEEIKNEDIVLKGLSSQKMARVLKSLIDIDLVRKGKDKNGKMIYRSLATKVKE